MRPERIGREVTVKTSDRSTVYTQGEYPVGHITRVIETYSMVYDTFQKLNYNMQQRIKLLEKNINSEHLDSESRKINKAVIEELKLQLLDVDAWWEPSMDKANYDAYYPKQECDMQLRHFPGDRLGGKGL